MPTTRKYPVSVGMTFELLQMIDAKVKSGGYRSRSELIQKILHENLDDECVKCQIVDSLTSEGLLRLPDNYPESIREAGVYIAEQLEVRRKRKFILSTIKENRDLDKILSVLEHAEISPELGKTIIDNFAKNGLVYRTAPNQWNVT